MKHTKVKIKLTPPQKQIYDSDARIRCLYGGRGSGKSYLSAVIQLTYALNNPGAQMMVVGVTANTVRNTNIKEFLNLCPDEAIDNYNRSTNEITLINGTHILFRSANSERDIDATMRGPNLHFAALDEIAVMSPYVWDVILPAVRAGTDEQQKIVITSTPKMNWVHEKFIKNPPKNCLVIDRISSHSNNNLTPGFLDALDDEFQGTTYYSQEILGDWIAQSGLVYDLNIISHDEIPATMQEYKYSIDFGFTAECAILTYGRKFDKWYMLKENYETGMTDEMVANELQVLYNAYAPGVVVCDSAQPQSIQYLKDHGIKATGADKGVDIGVRTTRNLLDNGTLNISDKCLNTIYEGSNFIYAKEDRDDKFEGTRHAMDSMRYFCMSIHRGAYVPTIIMR